MSSRKSIIIVSLLLFVCTILLTGAVRQITQTAAVSLTPEKPFLLIDPGHGGPDGGASTDDGVLEDDINLSVALILKDMLVSHGYEIKMTRTEDAAVSNEDDLDDRSWKTNDMYNRLSLYNAALFTVSIHQNHFSQSQYHGTQLFYSDNRPESRDIAACIRKQVISLLQPDNKRELKLASDSIFLLDRTERPAVIVECGFLSNPEEAARMQDPLYQQQMAFAIFCGIVQYAPNFGAIS
ncbi:MAG: N-acetylmuramoyl-L-alanine amidase [Clostridia bacterium]|nr:N-acetylmuramoyl-L-alanine amidase [Clostridia bacterium]